MCDNISIRYVKNDCANSPCMLQLIKQRIFPLLTRLFAAASIFDINIGERTASRCLDGFTESRDSLTNHGDRKSASRSI